MGRSTALMRTQETQNYSDGIRWWWADVRLGSIKSEWSRRRERDARYSFHHYHGRIFCGVAGLCVGLRPPEIRSESDARQHGTSGNLRGDVPLSAGGAALAGEVLNR